MVVLLILETKFENISKLVKIISKMPILKNPPAIHIKWIPK